MNRKIEIKEISRGHDLKRFVQFQRELYKGNKYYVPPIERMETKSLTYANPMTRNCEFKLWVAEKDGKVAGRIAGIINHNFNDSQNIRQARFSHFDCIESEDVATQLFDAAEDWAKQNQMEEIIGPFGFTNLDKHGLLVEGFEELSCQSSNYNYPYYKDFVEARGFEKRHDWIEHKVFIPSKEPEKIAKFAGIMRDRFQLKSLDLKDKKMLKSYAHEVFDVYNQTYSNLYGVSPLDETQKQHLLNNFIPYLHPDFVSIVVDTDERVVGFGIALPSMSASLQKAKGKLFPLGFFHLMNNARNNHILDLLLIGIHPDYQRKGINAIIFHDIAKGIFKHGIRIMETTQSLESNKDVLNLWGSFDSQLHKRARLYWKQL